MYLVVAIKGFLNASKIKSWPCPQRANFLVIPSDLERQIHELCASFCVSVSSPSPIRSESSPRRSTAQMTSSSFLRPNTKWSCTPSRQVISLFPYLLNEEHFGRPPAFSLRITGKPCGDPQDQPDCAVCACVCGCLAQTTSDWLDSGLDPGGG